MANNYLQFRESIGDITAQEAAWLRNVLMKGPLQDTFLIRLSSDSAVDLEYFPNFIWSIDRAPYVPRKKTLSTFEIFSEESGDPEHVALVVQEFFKEFRHTATFSLSYSCTSDKMRIGEFGGGALFVTENGVQHMDTNSWSDEMKKQHGADAVLVKNKKLTAREIRQLSKLMEFKGLHAYRLKQNPEEHMFAVQWNVANMGNHNGIMAHLMGDGARPITPTGEQETAAATVIQWLGSPVGQQFLATCGYTKKVDK